MTSLVGLLEWYAPRRSAYPWRGSNPDPYRVLVSEVMLQQTQASRVVPSFERFMRRFPNVHALAAAPVADVLREWSGLGYNRRAVALSSAARAIVRSHGGRVPEDPAELATLPGVGPYTAAAVASLAFARAVPAMDTNVRRILSRALLGVEPEEVPARHIRTTAEAAIDRSDPAAWNQALMDLGRLICRPNPRCDTCPISRSCRSAGRVPDPARPGRSPQASFEGSHRQIRGSVVRELADRGTSTLGSLARRTEHAIDGLAEAVRTLDAEGLVEAGPAALAGQPSGRVRLREAARAARFPQRS